MAVRESGADRAALLRRFNAANTSLPPQDLSTLNDFDGPQQEIDFDDEEFFLPISHTPSNNLVTDNLQQASMDVPIDSSNIGYKLLKKMGWKDQTGLGRGGYGIVDPIRINTNLGSLGVGKLAEDAEYTNAENIKRKALETEVELTTDQIKKRDVQVEKEKAIKEEVAEIVKVFYCELCNKQYKMITEYEAHLSSYDHNHKKRFQEMRQMEKARNTKKDKDKGVDKEMQRLMAQAAAAQQKYEQQSGSAPPPPPPSDSQPPPPPPPPNEPPPLPFNPPLPAFSINPPRSAIQFGFSAKKPALSSHSSFQPPPPPDDSPPPPPSSSSSEPARPAVKFGFAKKPGFLPNQSSSSHPPPPPPPDTPPPPPPNNGPPQPPSQPVKFSFNMPRKR